MTKINWKFIGLSLALLLTLSACGDDQQAKESASDQPTDAVVESQKPEETKAAEPSPSPSETQKEDVEYTAPPIPTATTEPLEDDPDEPPVPTGPLPIVGLMPEGEPVEETWFDDAAFVGDSRTDGLKLYSGIKGASFFSYKGLSVFNIDDQECIALDGERVTALEALSREQFAKVFIMLGINELGYRDIDAFRQAYSDLVAEVKASQPEADIYLQLQPPVNEGVAVKSGMAAHITNERVILFNEAITKVAEEHETALVDVWEALVTEEGELPAEITNDGVHMKVSGYKVWYDYLRRHTGTTEPVMPEEGEEPVEPETTADADELPEIAPPSFPVHND